MPGSRIQVRRVEKLSDADVEQATDAWVGAFKDDVFVRAVSAGDEGFFKRFLYSTLLAAIRGGEVYFASYDDTPIAGVAAWFPPGHALLDTPEQGEGGFHELFADFTPEFNKWWMEYFLPKYEIQNTETLGEGVKLASWHLQFIGVRPEIQHLGIGTALIEHVKVKAGGEALCVETENEENLKFYNSCGFAIKGVPGEYDNPVHNFTMWILAIDKA